MTTGAQVIPVSARARVRTTPVAWVPSVHLTVEEWQSYGTRLAAVSRSTNWWLGDWVRFGQRRYDLTYRDATRITAYDEQTLMNFAYVAGRYDLSRRRETLSWSHHAELAALTLDEQELWLDRAAVERLSVRRLRTALRQTQTAGDSQLAIAEQSQPAGDPESEEAAAPRLRCPHCGEWITLPA